MQNTLNTKQATNTIVQTNRKKQTNKQTRKQNSTSIALEPVSDTEARIYATLAPKPHGWTHTLVFAKTSRITLTPTQAPTQGTSKPSGKRGSTACPGQSLRLKRKNWRRTVLVRARVFEHHKDPNVMNYTRIKYTFNIQP